MSVINRPTKLIFDADMILFVALTSAERTVEWDTNFFTQWLDLSEAICTFDEHIKQITELVLNHWKIEGNYEIIMCLTSTEGNFRKDLFPEYKANRSQKKKPMCYIPMRDYIKDNYKTVEYPLLEADDCVGILADRNSIAISGDKDFRSIPCRLYDFMRNEYYDTTQEEADYFHLFQTLVGDTADNYKGCTGIGEVRAKRILDKDCSWDTVVKTYEANGLTEEDALLTARLAFILRKGYYNRKTGEIKLWEPQNSTD